MPHFGTFLESSLTIKTIKKASNVSGIWIGIGKNTTWVKNVKQ